MLGSSSGNIHASDKIMTMFGEIPFEAAGRSWSAFTPFERAVVIIGSSLCGGVFLSTGPLLGVPREPGFNGSVLTSGAPVTGMIAIVVALSICTVIGLLVAKLIDVESGLFCCCIGLATLAIRSGPIRPVLQYADGPSVFLTLAFESVILAIFVLTVWFALRSFFKPSIQSDGLQLVAPNEITDATLSQKLMVVGVQVVVMGVCELVLIQNDPQAQAIAGMAVSAFLAVLAAYMFMSLPEGVWYWTGPAVLGFIGYLLAFLNNKDIAIGEVNGWSAALARPTPLDYASVGTASALLAYWCSRRWAQPEEAEIEPAVQ
jgi:hypothetical protein